MNSLKNKIYIDYIEELNNLEIGYEFNSKTLKDLLELIFKDIFVSSDYVTSDELLKYLKKYD